MTVKHPAKFSASILDQFAIEFTARGLDSQQLFACDPFAGVGTVLDLALLCEKWHWWLNEIEPEWADQIETRKRQRKMPGVIITKQDWLQAGMGMDGLVDVVITSPVYGNRMADSHVQGVADLSKRITYTHFLGRRPSPGSAATLQWGNKYRTFHIAAWKRVHDVLRPDGWLFLNVSDHIRKGVTQDVSAWHRQTCLDIGFELVGTTDVCTPRMKFGANASARPGTETIYTFRKAST